jgi:mono/diheme cytochrome c family protein
MNVRLFLTFTLTGAMAGALFPLSADWQEGTPAGPKMPGQSVYEETCSRCHGVDGRAAKAPWLVPFGWNYSQALDIVRHGGPCGMPAFAESELSDEEVKEIVEYLKTLN